MSTKTSKIYNLISNQDYEGAINYIQEIADDSAHRNTQSVLAYCHYKMANYEVASTIYQKLSHEFSHVPEYKLWHIKCLIAIGDYNGAKTAADFYEKSKDNFYEISYINEILNIYLNNASMKLSDDGSIPSLKIKALSALLQKDFNLAKSIYEEQIIKTNNQLEPDVYFNLSLSFFYTDDYDKTVHYAQIGLKIINDILQKFQINSQSDQDQFDKISELKMRFLNLLATCSYKVNNYQSAIKIYQSDSSSDMQNRDYVYLHNMAILEGEHTLSLNQKTSLTDSQQKDSIEDENLDLSIQKLVHLIEEIMNKPDKNTMFNEDVILKQIIFNTILLCARSQRVSEANSFFTTFEDQLSSEQVEFISSILSSLNKTDGQSKSLINQKLKRICLNLVNNLRKNASIIQHNTSGKADVDVDRAFINFDESITKLIPALSLFAKSFWQNGEYLEVEKALLIGAEFCHDNITWQLNMAHALFMQEKFQECIKYYHSGIENTFRENNSGLEENIMDSTNLFKLCFNDSFDETYLSEDIASEIMANCFEDILSISPMMYANLCVSLVMVNRNLEAERIMRIVEDAENMLIASYLESSETRGEDTEPPHIYHLSIIKLVIGTLYCSKSNFGFGIMEVIKSLEPLSMRLGQDTWYFTKKCLICLLDNAVKHLVLITDDMYESICQFLSEVALVGDTIPLVNREKSDFNLLSVSREGDKPGLVQRYEFNTIGDEAREIHLSLLKLME